MKHEPAVEERSLLKRIQDLALLDVEKRELMGLLLLIYIKIDGCPEQNIGPVEDL